MTQTVRKHSRDQRYPRLQFARTTRPTYSSVASSPFHAAIERRRFSRLSPFTP